MSRNVENVISLEAAIAEPAPYRSLKVTVDGVNYAGVGDTVIGITLPGDLNRNYPTVQLIGRFAEGELGNGTDVVRGDLLEQAANGRFVKHTTGKIAAVAWSGASETGDRLEMIVLPDAKAAAPVMGWANGSAAAAADLPALKTVTEALGDDVAALRAALITAGVLV